MMGSERHVETTAGFSKDRTDGSNREDGPIRCPVLTVISHPDPTRIGACAVLEELIQGGTVALSRTSLDFSQPPEKIGMALDDPYLSREPIRFSLLENQELLIDKGKSRTEFAVGIKSIQGEQRIAASAWQRGIPVVLANRITLFFHQAKHPKARMPDYAMIGEGDAMSDLRAEIGRVLDVNVTTLIRGPSGSGKERVAQAIHDHGRRRDRPFVSVNLGAIPPNLAASELFGAVRGAYTGAGPARPGFFAKAHRGTIFLDEIGETQTDVQAMLLRVLETGEMFPVGSATPVKVDVRIIAATDADLGDMVATNRFREALFHRLSGYTIWVPPLAQRKEDLGRLFRHFAQQVLSDMKEAPWHPSEDPRSPPWLTPDIAVTLLDYDWPGNVRQLQNLVRQLVIGNRERSQLEWTEPARRLLGKVGKLKGGEAYSVMVGKPRQSPVRKRPSEISEAELVAALRKHRWNFKATAEGLGISRASLYTLSDQCPKIGKVEKLTDETIRRAWSTYGGDLNRMADYFAVSRKSLQQRLKAIGLD